MMIRVWHLFSAMAFCLEAPALQAAPPVDKESAESSREGGSAPKELTGLSAKETTFQTGRPLQAKVIRSQKEASELLSDTSAAELARQVDFAKESVVLFAWKGSGQDRLKASTLNHQTVFSLEPGRTRDLREHVRAYALAKNTHWAIGVSYDEVKSLILKDKVRHAMQLHNRKVTVTTADGVNFEAIEPNLDDIVRFIMDNKKDIPIATE